DLLRRWRGRLRSCDRGEAAARGLKGRGRAVRLGATADATLEDEMLRSDEARAGELEREVHHLLQLTHVAAARVAHEDAERLARQPMPRDAAGALRGFRKERPCEGRDLRAALAERWDLDHDARERPEELHAERPVAGAREQVLP